MSQDEECKYKHLKFEERLDRLDLTKQQKQMFIGRLNYSLGCIPKKYSLCCFDACDKQNSTLICWAKEWVKNPTSVFITGSVGCGKTYFAYSMLIEILKRLFFDDEKCKFITSPSLDSELLAASKSDYGDRDAIKNISRYPFLFIDDFGREMKSDRVKRQYFEIINYRYAHELPTIITSNFSLEQIGEMLESSIASRIQEWQLIEFSNQDLRSFL